MHEVLLNMYEIKSSIDVGNCYVLLTPNNNSLIKNSYHNFKRLNMKIYSSDKVPLLSKTELKSIFIKQKLIK